MFAQVRECRVSVVSHLDVFTVNASVLQFRTKLTKSHNLITSMLNEVLPSVRRNLNSTVVVMELLDPLMDIIQPTLRPVRLRGPSWGSVGLRGVPWAFVELCGAPWGYMGLRRATWGSVGLRGARGTYECF